MELSDYRQQIDGIDSQLLALFYQRMEGAAQIAGYKKAHNLPALDAGRERAKLQQIADAAPEDLREYAVSLYSLIFELSRSCQNRLLGVTSPLTAEIEQAIARTPQLFPEHPAVACQGVEGAFSHIALTRLFQHVRAQAYPTWAEVFDAVAGGDAAYGVLPFENSHAGDVSEVLDLCYAHRDICVCDVYDLPVSQNLLGVPGAHLSDVKKAVSHPQALQQSAKFIRSLGLETQAFQNTAAAAKSVAEAGDKSVAAIASLETAALYGLSVLAENINTSETNTTRFIVIGRRMNAAGNRFSLLFTVDHRAGRLARVMQLIGAMGFNLECIKSRPMPNVPWEYYFYVEVVGDLSAEKSKELLDTLSGVCRTVRVLGVYDRQAAR